MKKSPEQMGFIDNYEYPVEEGFGCLGWIRNVVKITAEFGLVGLETVVLATRIIPTLLSMSNADTTVEPTQSSMNVTNGTLNTNSNNTLNPNGNNTLNPHSNNTLDMDVYKDAAIAYICLYGLGIIATTVYWFLICAKRRYPIGAIFFIALFLETPLIISEVYLLKSQHEFTWHHNKWDIFLLLALFANIVLEVFIELIILFYSERTVRGLQKTRKRCCCGGCCSYCCHGCCCKLLRVLLAAVLGLMISSLVAIACFAPSYWAVIGESTLYPIKQEDAVEKLAKGTCSYTDSMAYVLLLIGYAGQWAGALVLLVMMFSLWFCLFSS